MEHPEGATARSICAPTVDMQGIELWEEEQPLVRGAAAPSVVDDAVDWLLEADDLESSSATSTEAVSIQWNDDEGSVDGLFGLTPIEGQIGGADATGATGKRQRTRPSGMHDGSSLGSVAHGGRVLPPIVGDGQQGLRASAPARAIAAPARAIAGALYEAQQLSYHRAFELAKSELRARPDFLCAANDSPINVYGQVFVEASTTSRRKGKTDLWEVKRSASSEKEARVSGLGPDELIRRSYGTLVPRPPMPGVQHNTGWVGKRLTFHAYDVLTRIHKEDCRTKDTAGSTRVIECSCPFTVPKANAPHASYKRVYHVLGEVSGEQVPPPERILDTSPGTHTIRGPLNLKQQHEDDSWIVFQDVGGTEQGRLMRGTKGLTLQTNSGDFAEWHPRAPGEVPFEEGDVVGISPQGLTRNTQNAPQIAVISRWAAIEASTPPVADRDAFDRVAYTGQVPVKLRGCCNVGDIVVPSGCNDGIAKAIASDSSRAVAVPRLGRCLQAHDSSENKAENNEFELQDLACGSNATTTMVTISVVSPADSIPVGSRHRRRLLPFSPAQFAGVIGAVVLALLFYTAVRLLLMDDSHDIHTEAALAPHVNVGASALESIRSVCQHCHGDHGLYCERDRLSAVKGCSRCQWSGNGDSDCLVFTGAGPTTALRSCTATGGIVCVPSPWSCSACSSSAVESSSFACELSGGAGDLWGKNQPHFPDGSTPLRGEDKGTWRSARNVQCLTSLPESCMPPMMWNETTQIPRSCWYRTLNECGSDAQAFGLAGSTWPCGPTQIRAANHSSCPNSNWSWVGRQCQVQVAPGGLSTPRALSSVETILSSDCVNVQDSWQIGSGVEESCKSQSVSLIACDRCVYCERKDVIVGFSGAPFGTRLSVECPVDTHVGNVTGLCGHSGWTTVSGACVRKSCPSSQSDLAVQVWAFLTTGGDEAYPPWPELDDISFRRWSDPDFLVGKPQHSRIRNPPPALGGVISQDFQGLGATVSWAQTVEGTNVTLPCPNSARHSFAGSISRICRENSSEWNEPQGQCLLLQCPAGIQTFFGGSGSYQVLMPAASLGATVELDCCSNYTKAGGCQSNEPGGFFLVGRLKVTCGTAGSWPTKPNAGRCLRSDTVKFRMDEASGTRRGAAFDTFKRMAQHIMKNHDRLLPNAGILTSISALHEKGGEWMPLASTKTGAEGSTDELYIPVLDSVSEGSAGRGAAAVASVGCRQLGMTRAAFVTNCAALLLLELESENSTLTCVGGLVTTSDGWKCDRWKGQPSSLLASLCGDGDGRIDFGGKISWSGLGTDSQVDDRFMHIANPSDPHKNGAADNPSTYMATTTTETVIGWLEKSQEYEFSRKGHASVFARGWSMSRQEDEAGNCKDTSDCFAKLRQSRGPRLSTCEGAETSLAQCFREPLLRYATGVTPLVGFDWQGIGWLDESYRIAPRFDAAKLLTVDWRQRLLFGCTDEEIGLTGSGTKEHIWVMGDKLESSSASLTKPRVFTDVLPRKCGNALRYTKAATMWARVSSSQTDCLWGTWYSPSTMSTP